MDLVGKPKLIRKINRNIILKFIRAEQVITKSRLYELTNLSKQTINNIVSSLIKKGLVIEAGYGKSTDEGGKKPLLVKFNPNAYYLVGAMIGLNRIKCGITNLNGEILIEKNIKTQRKSSPENMIKRLIKLVNTIINKSNINRNKLLGIGIGMPGVVNFDTGVVNILPLFYKWEKVPLRKILEKEFKMPIIIDNENRMRAVGEKWFGIAKGIKNFITIITGDGIGVGVVINNEVVRGRNFICGEIGHMKLNVEEPECVCGSRGCFETLINISSINQSVKEITSKDNYESSPLFKIYKKNNRISFHELFDNFNKGDKLAGFIVEKMIFWFGMGLSNLVCAYDPEIIIIHGEYLSLNDIFFEKLKEVVYRNVFPKMTKVINIRKSKIGKDIGIMGSSSIVLDTIEL